MREFKDFEKLLYGAKTHYRDHVAHSFRVFLLGQYLIDNNFGFKKIDVYDKLIGKNKVSGSEKEAMWCIISLTHDIGYALEDIDTFNEKIRDMIKLYGKASFQELAYIFPPQRHTLDDFVIRFISSDLVPVKNNQQQNKEVKNKNPKEFWTHVQSKYYLKYNRAYENFDHGIISCTVLMRELVYFLESDYQMDCIKPMKLEDAKQFAIRQTILRSIASHNCEEIYYLTGVSFPFILMIVDEFQEWGRPKLDQIFSEKNTNRSVTISKFEENSLPGGLNVDFTVEMNYKDANPDFSDKRSKEVKKYFIRKTTKFIKVLRSAVGGNIRSINFKFTVNNSTESGSGKQHIYTFELKTPKPEETVLSPIWYIDEKKKASLKEVQDELFGIKEEKN